MSVQFGITEFGPKSISVCLLNVTEFVCLRLITEDYFIFEFELGIF